MRSQRADIILRNWQTLPKLPDHIEAELAAMSNLSDQALWILARSTIDIEDQEQFSLLNQEAKLRVLSDQEEEKLDALLNQYDENMIRRAQAASLLGKRGYNMSDPTVLRPE